MKFLNAIAIRRPLAIPVILVVMLSWFNPVHAQNISTMAGTGVPAFGGDDSAAVNGRLNNPYGLVADAAGNVYVADCGNNRLRKISTSGIITTIAGTGTAYFSGDGGQATAAHIQGPRTVALDPSGNIIFSDYGNNRIRKINMSTGIITTLAGTPTPGYGGDGGPSTAAQLNYAQGVACDPSGNIYIADQLNNRVRKINTSGTISTICGTGTVGSSGDGGPASLAKLQYPTSVACDAYGNIFIADRGNCTVRKINSSGIISRYAGLAPGFYSCGFTGDGGQATNAKMDYPTTVSVDEGGNLFIADFNNNRIRRVNTSGIITTVAGTATAGFSGDGGPATAAELSMSTGVAAISALGKVFIADDNNNRVRVINYLHAPIFDGGRAQYLTACYNSGPIDINSYFTVDDISIGQTEIWSLVTAAHHGSASVSYTTTSTGSTMYVTGCSYTPGTGYSGLDTFEVRVTNGLYSDTTLIYVDVLPLAHASLISGLDSVCPGHVDTLSDSASGGTWVSMYTSVASISATGVVTGLVPGIDTILYTVSNVCDTSTAMLPILVRSYASCHTGVEQVAPAYAKGITLSQNPNKGTFSVVVHSNNGGVIHLTVTDLTGRKVKQYSFVADEPFNINGSFAPGTYMLVASDGHDTFKTKMVVTE